MMMAVRPFSSAEVTLAALLALGVEFGLFTLFVMAGENAAKVRSAEPPAPIEMPIAVKPVLDDLPILKLGGKKVKPKLPDMWAKNPPVRRYEEASAPSPKAAKTPEAIPTSKLAALDASPPPPDAEVAKKVDEVLPEAGAPADAEVTVEGPGAPGGVQEGTETDPLKARQMGLYEATLIRWFTSRFSAPELPEEEARSVRARVQFTIGPDRTVGGWSMIAASGNAEFDSRVTSTMNGTVGSTLPRPPESLGDVTGKMYGITFKPPPRENP